MKSNAPVGYRCPICLGNKNIEREDTFLKKSDLVFRDNLVLAWVNSFWIKGNEGHIIIVPNEHFENLYDLPNHVGHRIFEVSKLLSGVMKDAYNCDGITLRQNNEPAGDQHAFHYHLHVYPRYNNDQFNQELAKKSFLSPPEDRSKRAEKLKIVLGENR